MKSFVMTGTQDGLKSIPLSRLTPDQLRWGGADAEGFGTDIVTLYKAIPWLNRGVKARCNALVSMPYALHSGIGEDGAEVEETVLPAGMEIDLHDLIYTFAFHHILFGAAYGAKHSNRYRMDKPFRIFLPRTIKPEYDSAKGLTGFKRVVNGEAIEYTTDEMVWLWAKNPDSEVGPGPSDAQVALNAAGVLYFMDGYGNRFFAGGANNNTLVLLPDATTDAERERVQGWINRSVTGVRNAFKMIAVAMKEVKTVSLGTTPKELVIPELTAAKREDIATALGVPQTLLFSNAANFATARQDDIHFYDKTVKPDAYMIAKALNKKLFHPMGYTLVFHPERMEIYQQLESNKAVGVVTLYRGGIMGRAEGREYMGLASDTPADVLDVSGMGTGQDQNSTGATLPELSAAKSVNNATIIASSAIEHTPSCTCTACNPVDDEFADELKRWKAMAQKRLKEGKPDKAREFKSEVIPVTLMASIRGALEALTDAAQLGGIFDNAMEWKAYP